MLVLRIVIRALLSNGIRWVAHNHRDWAVQLPLHAGAVLSERGLHTLKLALVVDGLAQDAPLAVHFLTQLEGVGETDAVEGDIGGTVSNRTIFRLQR